MIMPALKNPKHEAFARNVGIKGMGAAEAYREVYDCADSTAESEGPRFCKNPQISTRISHFREIAAERAAEKDFLTVEEKRNFLARVVRAHGKKLDFAGADADLIQGVKLDKFGNEMLEIPDKLAAIRIDNDLAVDGAEAEANKAMEIIIRKL